MTGPKGPDDEDWGFPEVDPAGPASVQLPEPAESAGPAEHDTGSDAWWRAQAEAQRRAAENEPVVTPAEPAVPPPTPPPELVEPHVLRPAPPSGPLDQGWLPADLPELRPPVTPEPPAPEVVRPEPVDPPAAAPPAAPPVEEPAPSFAAPPSAPPAARAPHEGERIGPGRAVAGAALALAGVALGIGALLLAGKQESKLTPTVAAPTTAATTVATATATATATPTPAPPATTQPPAQPSPPPAKVTVPPGPAVAPVVPVSVLNNSRIKGLAQDAAARFRAGGWPVPAKGNYSGGIIAVTTVYYAPGQLPSAERFARQFGIPRVAPRFPGLPTAGMTVVLTRDYR